MVTNGDLPHHKSVSHKLPFHSYMTIYIIIIIVGFILYSERFGIKKANTKGIKKSNLPCIQKLLK